MADPTLISFSTLFFICQEFTCWFYQKSDNDFNIYFIGFFLDCIQKLLFTKKSIDLKPLYLVF